MKTLITIICLCMTVPVWADELNPIAIPLPYDVSKSLSYDAPEYDPNEPATVTVLFVYTTAADSFASTTYVGGLDTLINDAMSYANLTTTNSEVGLEFEVVGLLETDYIESGDSITDLKRLTNPSDGHMDGVHDTRDSIGADLVVLLAYVNDVGGVGWVMTSPSGDSSYGFSLVRVQQMAGSTTVHEMGHNLGLHHSKLQNASPGPGVFFYSAGGRWLSSAGVPYCSVMTYTGGSYYPDGVSHSRIPMFSNPRVFHLGTPTGDVDDADNARTAMQMKHIIAAYRYQGGRLQVNIEPSRAQWRVVDTQTWHDSGHEVELPVGPTEVEFSDVRGWVIPQPRTVQVSENQLTTVNISYDIETCIVLIAPVEGGQLVPIKSIVNYGDNAIFQVRPDDGYFIDSVTGCGGVLSGSTYTTGEIYVDCTILAGFKLMQKPVVASSSGGGGGGCFITVLGY